KINKTSEGTMKVTRLSTGSDTLRAATTATAIPARAASGVVKLGRVTTSTSTPNMTGAKTLTARAFSHAVAAVTAMAINNAAASTQPITRESPNSASSDEPKTTASVRARKSVDLVHRVQWMQILQV